MKKSYIGVGVLVLAAFLAGFYGRSTSNIAVVNVKMVLDNYPELRIIKRENNVKLNELSAWLDGVTKEVNAEKDKAKREKLAAQYKKLALEKETLIKQDYTKKIQGINETVSALIDEVAKKAGCRVVLANTSVVSGGKNITDEVLKKMKPEAKK